MAGSDGVFWPMNKCVSGIAAHCQRVCCLQRGMLPSGVLCARACLCSSCLKWLTQPWPCVNCAERTLTADQCCSIWGATWELPQQPKAPLSLRITDDEGNEARIYRLVIVKPAFLLYLITAAVHIAACQRPALAGDVQERHQQ